jgi:hypothetical protein
MALCERCSAEINSGLEPLPEDHFDNLQHSIRRPDGERRLPRLPWHLLSILWHRRSQYVSVESLAILLYSGPHDIDEPADAAANIRTHICRLRDYLQGLPFSILCRHRVGYRLVENDLGLYPDIGPLEPCEGPQPQYRGKYPFAVMRIGQSFLVRDGDLDRVRSAITEAHARGPGRFAARREPGAVRVTRLQD